MPLRGMPETAQFCAPAEAQRAVAVVNKAFEGEAFSLGCRIQLGLQIMLAALAALPAPNRAEVTDAIELRLEEACGAPASITMPPMPAERAGEIIARAKANAELAMTG